MNEREIFLAALQIEDAGKRRSYLDSVCAAGDPVRKRVNKLLKAHSRPQDAIDRVAGYIAEQNFETDNTSSLGTDSDPETSASPHAQLRKAIGGLFRPPETVIRPGKEASIPPGTQLDRYQIIERIGYGGMGEVYLAHDKVLNRDIAVKLLSREKIKDNNWLLQFRREARAVGALNHPNILTIFEIGEAQGVPFLATEFVDGETLRQLLSGTRVSLGESIDFAIQLAGALAAAHKANIIHRDIKPENLMVRKDGLLKVLDFGLAKQLSIGSPLETSGIAQDNSRFNSDPGIVIGSVRYMSPEQARGLQLDTRTDLFSLGIVLYELLTGKRPFDGDTPSDVLVAILEREPIPVSRLVPEIPKAVEIIVSRCLSKDRGQRYSSAIDLLVDLKQANNSLDADSNLLVSMNSKVDPVSIAANDITSTTRTDSSWDYRQNEMPPVQYTRSGDVNIAYQVQGEGAFDLVFVMGWVSHLEMFWKEPSFARFLNRLATFARLIMFDKRGTGLSDKVPIDELPTLEQRMDDVRAVMEAVGSERAVLCGISEGGPMCTLFAATYPEKTIALTMIGCYARRLWAPDYPWGPTEEHREHFFEEMRRDWGGPVGIEDRAPSKAGDPQFRNWWASYLRMGASPGAALALTQMNAQIDIRPILSTVQVPTLVIHRTHDRCLLVEEGRFLSEQIPGAKFVELPGDDHLPFVGDQDAILDEIEEFLTGVRHSPMIDRVLATVLFILFEPHPGETVDAEQMTKTDKLFQSHVVREAELFKGRNVSFRKNAVLITFDGPARAVRAGIAINETAKRLGISLRTGVHTGECDLVNEQASGTAVELSEQVAHSCPTGETLVSSTVKDLVVGSGLQFESHSTINLHKQLGELSLFLVVR